MDNLVAKKRQITPTEPVADSTIMVVTDHPGHKDIENNALLSGFEGKLFREMCKAVGLNYDTFYVTSVIKEVPDGRSIYSVCRKKAEVDKEAREFGWDGYTFKPISPGNYLRPFYCLSLLTLREEIRIRKPSIIIALGQLPMWALCGVSSIQKSRGVVLESTLVPGTMVLPTYSPKVVNKKYEFKPVATIDLNKAKTYAEGGLRETPRSFYIPTKVTEVEDLIATTLSPLNAPIIAHDIETIKNKWITCVSSAPNINEVVVFPFIYRKGKHFEKYWSSQDELEVWKLLKQHLENPDQEIVGHNFVYDISYYFSYKIKPTNVRHDTMLAHHAMFPELPKSLGFLGSIYLNEMQWKDMRPRGKASESTKADDE